MGAKETIVALSTGKGRSAIAAIRLSGPSSFSAVESCLIPAQAFVEQEAGRIGLFTFVNHRTKIEIDQITAIKFRAPKSFTGEDMVELFCHGGEIVVEKIISELVDCGAVIAERGEYTRRAFYNGKIDLGKAEAILGLIESKSEREYLSSAGAYFGGYRKNIEIWKRAIASLLRDTEARIEFPDEDDVLNKEKISDQVGLQEIIKEIEKEINKKEKAKIIEKGINIPIVGIANAGKSCLFNLMLECDRSIVHWEEGTTRDSISEEIQIGSEKIRLLDTAGLRDTQNYIESIGIAKTKEHIVKSVLVIWVTPANVAITLQEKEMVLEGAKNRILCIISKVDLGNVEEKEAFLGKEKIPFISTCLLDVGQREKIISFISDQINKKIGSIEMPDVIRNKRQETAARKLVEILKEAQKNKKNGEEIFARFLQKALEEISFLVGETTSEEILNNIFSEFCVGK